MNESSYKRYVIVGFFVFIGLAILVTAILLIGDLHKAFEKKVEVVSIFNDVAGLQKGNNVWLSGVKVGIISNITFTGKSKVKVSILVDTDVKKYIPNDSKVKISNDGFIGNKILVIFDGTEKASCVKDGDILAVEEQHSTEEMINTFRQTNDNILAITNDFKVLSKRLVNGEGTMGKLLNDNSVYTNINTSVASLQKVMGEAQKVMSSLKTFSSNLNKEGTLANELVTDTLMFTSIKTSVMQLQQITIATSEFVKNLNQKITDQNTSLGVLLNDKESGTNVKETIKNLESSSIKLNEDLEALQHNMFLKKYFKNKAKSVKKDTVVNGKL